MGSASGAGRADPDRGASPSYTLSCQRARDSGTTPGIQHIPEDSDRLRLYQDIRVGLATWAWLDRTGQWELETNSAVSMGQVMMALRGAMGSWAVGRGSPDEAG